MTDAGLLDIADIPFFSQLPSDGLARLRQLADVCSYTAGSVICRKGEVGSAFFVVASGGVNIQLGPEDEARKTNVYLRPGQVFGEMSLLSGMPISATVVAARDTLVYALSKDSFLELLETQPALRQALVQMFIERIRHRSSLPSELPLPPCTLIVLPPGVEKDLFSLSLFHAVEHYAPGSFFLDTVSSRGWKAVPPDEVRPLLPESARSLRKKSAPATRAVYAIDESASWVARLIRNWRGYGSTGQVLTVTVSAGQVEPLKACLENFDSVVLYEGPFQDQEFTGMSASGFGLARVGHVRIGSRREMSSKKRHGPWFFCLAPDELDRVTHSDATQRWDRTLAPNLDWIARWITGREIGIAMSSGAACGFAHLGVLQVLEEAGITIDYLCGSSMGGAAALIYAKTGNVTQTLEMSRDLLRGNMQVVDVSWWPKSSLLAGRKLGRIIDDLWGNATFAEFEKPAAAVAADLVKGERFVLERGPAATAVRATSAIPGIFPPVSCGGRMLVDGALVSHIPLELLERRRCGLKIAVIVTTAPGNSAGQEDIRHGQMREKFERLLGLRHVISSSWELQSLWRGSAEALNADIVLYPRSNQASGFDFGALNEMVEAGRKAAEEKLDFIQKSLASLLKPGVP
ncbi:MAG TPA: cyclic nucleotide-binding domain-containing protein [Syntrophales bacterium]|nr:cyclic nucleotide-binding domain-containing protein [Syntrophales bacterium]